MADLAVEASAGRIESAGEQEKTPKFNFLKINFTDKNLQHTPEGRKAQFVVGQMNLIKRWSFAFAKKGLRQDCEASELEQFLNQARKINEFTKNAVLPEDEIPKTQLMEVEDADLSEKDFPLYINDSSEIEIKFDNLDDIKSFFESTPDTIHEVRNPLTVVFGNAQMILKSIYNEKRYPNHDELIKTINRQGARLNRTVDFKIEDFVEDMEEKKGAEIPPLEEVQFSDLIVMCKDRLNDCFGAADVVQTITVDPSSVTDKKMEGSFFSLRKKWFQEALDNIIWNSRNHAYRRRRRKARIKGDADVAALPDKFDIAVKLSADGKMLEIHCIDNGIGYKSSILRKGKFDGDHGYDEDEENVLDKEEKLTEEETEPVSTGIGLRKCARRLEKTGGKLIPAKIDYGYANRGYFGADTIISLPINYT